MKKHLSPILFVAALVACQHNDEVNPPENPFVCNDTSVCYMRALKNDTVWSTVEAEGWISKSLHNILIMGRIPENQQSAEEQLDFWVDISHLNTQDTIREFKAEFLFLIGGDAFTDDFHLSSVDNDWIKLSEIDTIGHIIKGTFSADLKSGYSAKTLHFRQGCFSVLYQLQD